MRDLQKSAIIAALHYADKDVNILRAAVESVELVEQRTEREVLQKLAGVLQQCYNERFGDIADPIRQTLLKTIASYMNIDYNLEFRVR